jgi:hypothetical protein
MVEDDFYNILEYKRMCDLHGSDATRLGKVRDDVEDAYGGEWDSQEDFDSHIFNAHLSSSLNISIMTTSGENWACSISRLAIMETSSESCKQLRLSHSEIPEVAALIPLSCFNTHVSVGIKNDFLYGHPPRKSSVIIYAS